MKRMKAEAESRALAPLVVGRYALYRELASGGMATVHLGRLIGAAGFSRTVAIKRLHPHFAKDPEFVSMFLDEARLAARIKHPNVVPTLDVVADGDELFLVMEYVHGEALSRIRTAAAGRGERIPPRIAAAIVVGALHGLHAAHEARDEQGRPLEVVHRDVSPQNILVGADGVPRVLDFGVAKATGRTQQTREGQLKGKLAYMAPEQFRRERVTRSVDVYAATIVLWEALTGQRLFAADNEAAVVENVLYGRAEPPSRIVPELPREIDTVVERGLSRAPQDRYATAQDLAIAVEECLGVASSMELGGWLSKAAAASLEARGALVAAVEGAGDPSQAVGILRPVPVSGPRLAQEDTVAKAPVTLSRTQTSVQSRDARGTEGETVAAPGDDVAAGSGRSRRWTVATAAAVVGVIALGAFGFSRGHGNRTSEAAPTPEGTAATSATVAEPPAPSVQPSSAAISPAPDPTITPSAVAAPPATAPASAHPRHARPAGTSKPSGGLLPKGLPSDRD